MPIARRGSIVLAVVPIATLAIALRAWRLGWGLPRGWFPDEMFFTFPAAGFVPLRRASFALTWFNYPALFGYLAGASTALCYAVGLHAGQPHGFSPSTILVTRATSAAAGVASVGLLGVAGTRLYGSVGVGLLAAALLAVTPFHVLHSHIAAVDVLLAGTTIATMLAAHRLVVRGDRWSAAAAGAAAGLAFASKQPGLAMLAPVAWAVCEAGWRAQRPARVVMLGLVAAAGFVVAYTMACPPCVRHWDKMLEAMSMHRVTQLGLARFPNNRLAPTLGWYARPYVYQLVASLPFCLGWSLDALAMVGVGLAAWRREAGDRVVLATLIPYFVTICIGGTVFPRLMLPLLPGLVLLAARALVVVPGPRSVRAVVATAVLAHTLALTVTHVARFSSDQQQDVARWLAATAAERPRAADAPFRVAVPTLGRLDYYRLVGPLRDAGLTPLPTADGHWLDDNPDAFVLPEWTEIAIRRDEPDGATARELDRLESGAAGYHLARRWRSTYLERDLYTRLDPAFAGDLWQGEIGFAVFIRE